MICERCGKAEMYRVHAVWRCPECGVPKPIVADGSIVAERSVRPEVTIVEVGPRDGLQNEAAFVPTADKIALVDRLSRAGHTRMEPAASWMPSGSRKWLTPPRYSRASPDSRE